MDEPKQIVNPDHITYREYKKRLTQKPFQGIVLFISAFFILLLAFLGMAKFMSPDVDISIGDEPEVTYEEEGVIRGNVDNRLKQIQDEDNGVGAKEESMFATELDERVVIPEKETRPQAEPLKVQEEAPILLEHNQTKANEQQNIEKNIQNTETQTQTQTAQQAEQHQNPVPQAPVPVASNKVYKVYVGSYSSASQAEVAKGIISESNIGVNTFVKNLNGSYTLQAGSYSSAEKAQAAANDLLRNNFPARVVAE